MMQSAKPDERRSGENAGVLTKCVLHPATRTTLFLGALMFLVWLAIQHRNELFEIIARADLPLLAAAVALGILANYLSGLILMPFLAQHGNDTSLGDACRLQLIAQIGKYIPGKVWSSVMQAQMARSGAISRYFLAGVDVMLFTTLLMSGIGLALLVAAWNAWAGGALAVLAIVLAALVASQAILVRLSRYVASLLRARPSTNTESRSAKIPVRTFLVAGFVFAALVTGTFVLVLLATTGFRGPDLLVATASVLLSWVLGVLAFVVPGGLGVREAAFMALASAFGLPVDIQSLAAVAIIIRAVTITQDLVVGVILTPKLLAGAFRKTGSN